MKTTIFITTTIWTSFQYFICIIASLFYLKVMYITRPLRIMLAYTVWLYWLDIFSRNVGKGKGFRSRRQTAREPPKVRMSMSCRARTSYLSLAQQRSRIEHSFRAQSPLIIFFCKTEQKTKSKDSGYPIVYGVDFYKFRVEMIPGNRYRFLQ